MFDDYALLLKWFDLEPGSAVIGPEAFTYDDLNLVAMGMVLFSSDVEYAAILPTEDSIIIFPVSAAARPFYHFRAVISEEDFLKTYITLCESRKRQDFSICSRRQISFSCSLISKVITALSFAYLIRTYIHQGVSL